MSGTIAAAVGRWGVVLVALIVTGCAQTPGPPAATAQGSVAPDRAAGADTPRDGGSAVQEAALQSERSATAADAAPDIQLRTEATERGLVIALNDVAFAPGSAALERDSMPLLTRLAAFLREHPTRNAMIEGHTDDTGTPTENLHLSLKRAEAVQEVLIDHAVDPQRLILRGYGARYPIAGNETEAGRQKNRRVEVVVLEQGETTAPPPRELTAGR